MKIQNRSYIINVRMLYNSKRSKLCRVIKRYVYVDKVMVGCVYYNLLTNDIIDNKLIVKEFSHVKLIN